MQIRRALAHILQGVGQNYKAILINAVCVIGIIILGSNTFRVLQVGIQRYRLIAEERADLETVKAEEESLQNDLQWYSSLEFIEMQSRDYLNLANEGEAVLVLPDSDLLESVSNREPDSSSLRLSPSINLWIKLLL